MSSIFLTCDIQTSLARVDAGRFIVHGGTVKDFNRDELLLFFVFLLVIADCDRTGHQSRVRFLHREEIVDVAINGLGDAGDDDSVAASTNSMGRQCVLVWMDRVETWPMHNC